jgi:putative transposase
MLNWHINMERKFVYNVGDYYHIFNRGVEKRKIFRDTKDWERFQQLLYVANTKEPINFRSNRCLPFDMKRSSTLADVIAYSQMPNHYHLILHETIPGGICKFISKVSTAYSMYFNVKYERSGPVFCRPYRARHVDNDDYFRWLFSYVNLNPIPLFKSTYDTHDTKTTMAEFMNSYKFASYTDYMYEQRLESKILNKEKLLFDIKDLPSMDDMFATIVRVSDQHHQQVQQAVERPWEKDWDL